MLRTVSHSFEFSFSRAGGSVITSRVDVWLATQAGWQNAGQFVFNAPANSKENLQGELPPGSYTCVFQCYVEESLNGIYDFSFEVNGHPTFQDRGDVNTTAAKDDAKVYKDQFILVVQ
jgi:hypothetical protein